MPLFTTAKGDQTDSMRSAVGPISPQPNNAVTQRDVKLRLFGEGDMWATVRYPLLSPTLDFDIEVVEIFAAV